LGGWLNGTRSYLRIGDRDDTMLGSVSDGKLYRLAKAIVQHYEAEHTHESKRNEKDASSHSRTRALRRKRDSLRR
jgi:hypothetical protein